MASSCAPGQHPALDERLYFGTQRPDGVVSDGEWNRFVDEVIAAALPDGFTTWPAQGAWRGADGTIDTEKRALAARIAATGYVRDPELAR